MNNYFFTALVASSGTIVNVAKDYDLSGNFQPGDAVKINQAIQDAGDGSIVVIPKGNYLVDEQIIVNKNRFKLISIGAVFKTAIDDAAILVHTAYDVTVSGFEIDGDKGAFTGAQYANGITVTNSTKVTISYNDIYDTQEQGILFTGISSTNGGGNAANFEGDCSFCFCENNRIENAGNGAIPFQTVSDVYCRYNEILLPVQEGIQPIDGCERVYIQNNVIRSIDTPSIAIECHDRTGAGDNKDIWIEYNDIITNSWGVYFDHPDFDFINININKNTFTLESNIVTTACIGSNDNGFNILGLSICDNILNCNNEGNGIFFENATITDFDGRGNKIKDAIRGIYSRGNIQGQFKNNILRNCDTNDNTQGANFTISGNEIV